ncbi:kinase-like protein [Cucurbitaria berberidis CBS 394.84]|uniref:Kinase-like protein n=1 Tax=Cucurbitaria berberidis CBS 394.84 TaxID=1168544 RepID=A0A9P4GSN8_9PLEO|nr:kinase-like protein [Cucurbitaria berberidis CBS 394.84]KAF1850799.1 kinase-like protein [Cucurbitaria berberidis CBS 394.84]
MGPQNPIIRISSHEWDGAQPMFDIRHDHSIQMKGSDCLDGVLRKNFIQQHADMGDKIFWPPPILKNIMTKDHVSQELARLKSDKKLAGDPFELVHKIIAGYLKVFATLTLAGKGKYIEKFIQDGVTDGCLPLQVRGGAISRTDAPNKVLACFEELKSRDKDCFLQYQHQVNPVILGFNGDHRTTQHKDLRAGAILPFTEVKPMRDGGFSTVIQVTVHPDCHGFNDFLKPIIVNDKFALKELSASGTATEFRKELDALKRFTHKHLITLLMSWTFNNRYNLLFPLAGANLEDYWSSSRLPGSIIRIDIDLVQWISKQIVGMAGALNAVHEPTQFLQAIPKYGRHGDLKPENILWYQSEEDSRGILVIADLGLSAINSDKSRSNIPNNGIPGTPGYRPPECDLDGGKISRSYDIWTFGCLLLELVCWALGGEENRQEFEKARESPYITGAVTDIFFDVQVKENGQGYTITVKEQVRKWTSDLHNLPTCTEYFHELLDLIETQMIIALSQDRNRIKSPSLLETLERMHRRVMDGTDGYCRKACPKKHVKREPEPVDAILNIMANKMVRERKPALSTHKGETQKPKSRQELQNMP